MEALKKSMLNASKLDVEEEKLIRCRARIKTSNFVKT